MSYSFRGFTIPEYMMPGLEAYIEIGQIPGDFLYSVLTNDLERSVARADNENLRNLPAYIGYLYNKAPMECWGSAAKVEKWIDKKREERYGS